MNEDMSDLPQADTADPDGVQVALRAAHTLWSRGDTAESLKWLRKAAESASDEGADLRSLQLAKAAAELRAKLFGASEPPPRAAMGGTLSAASGSLSAGSFSAGAGSASFVAPLGGAAAASSVAPFTSSGSFPPTGVAPGESGSHPIAQPYARSESEPPRSASLSAAAAPGEALSPGPASEESGAGGSSRPVTATQYPSHRPRQRIGLLSSSSGVPRDATAYASVPSWSADSERRPTGAPPPLPRTSFEDYEELEAEPDEEPVDDPGSVWSSSGPESWRPPEPRSTPSGATPPPLPAGGAFSDDDFTQQSEAQTVVLPVEDTPLEAADEGAHSPRHPAAFGALGAAGGSLADPSLPSHLSQVAPAHSMATALQSNSLQSSAWDQQARSPSWDPDAGSSWAAELHQSTWGNPTSAGGFSEAASQESAPLDSAPQSEAARAKLTARVHHQAVRVSFAPDPRVPGQYVVRPLREGEKAATGERVALLVALEPGVPLV